MAFYFIYLLSIIALCGRYNIAGYHIIHPKVGFVMACAVIIFISAFRFAVGFDYVVYYSRIYPKLTIDKTSTEYLNKIIYYIADYFKAPVLVFVLFSLITYIPVFHTINKYSASRYESLIVYFGMIYLYSLSAMRQAVAIAILFFGFRFIKEKKWFTYFIICVIAANFHLSAVVGLVIYPLYHNRRYIITLGILCLLFIGFKYFLPILVGNLFPKYLNYLAEAELNSRNMARLFYLALFLYCFIVSAGKKELKKNCGLITITSIGVFLPYLILPALGGRLADYFLIYFVLLIPAVNARLPINWRSVMISVFYLYFILYLLVTTFNDIKGFGYVPYRFYYMTNRRDIPSRLW